MKEAKYINFALSKNINLSSLTEIDGDAVFDNTQNINLTSLTKIGGDAYFTFAENINLVSLSEVEGGTSFKKAKNIIFGDNKPDKIKEIANKDDDETIKKKIDFKMRIMDLILLVNELRFEENDLTEQQKIVFDELVGEDQLGVEYSEENQKKLEGLMEELSR